MAHRDQQDPRRDRDGMTGTFADLRFHVGAGDGNRTRTISLENRSGCSPRTLGTSQYCPKLQVSGVAPVHSVCSRPSSAAALTAVHGQKPVTGKAAPDGLFAAAAGQGRPVRQTVKAGSAASSGVAADASRLAGASCRHCRHGCRQSLMTSTSGMVS